MFLMTLVRLSSSSSEKRAGGSGLVMFLWPDMMGDEVKELVFEEKLAIGFHDKGVESRVEQV